MLQKHGTIPEIMSNCVSGYENICEGHLENYYHAVFYNAKNLYHGYHNYRHMFHFAFFGFQACIFERESWSPRQMRNLLIACIFHDFNHSGKKGPDEINIRLAIDGLYAHLTKDDMKHLDDIISLIWATEFPYKVDSDKLSLCCRYMRDLDMTQSLGEAWIQQVPLGLAQEWDIPPIEGLKMQPDFLRKLRFCTEWARQMFPQELIDNRIREAEHHVRILTNPRQ